MDDFYIIASHELHASNTAATENHAKGLKGIEIYRKDIFDFKNAKMKSILVFKTAQVFYFDEVLA